MALIRRYRACSATPEPPLSYYRTLLPLYYHTRLEPPADTPEAYPFPSTRCVRLGVDDVVRSAAAW